MKTMRAGVSAVVGALALAAMAATAGAQCLSAAGWKSGAAVRPAMSQPVAGAARLMRAAYEPAGTDVNDLFAEIVGMWHVKLVSSAVQGGPGVPVPPIGVEVDAGFQQWHNDGTEMLNSGRPAANSNFCMGVWERVGLRTFKLNHFAISYTQGPAPDAESGPSNTLTGPTSIVEEVTVSPNGKTFTGTFTITDYKETDTPQGSSIAWLDTISGTVTGTRIDVNTPVSPLF